RLHAVGGAQPRLRERADAPYPAGHARAGVVHVDTLPLFLPLLPEVRLRTGGEPLPVLVPPAQPAGLQRAPLLPSRRTRGRTAAHGDLSKRLPRPLVRPHPVGGAGAGAAALAGVPAR